MKRAEDNDDIILRCYETNKEATEVNIYLRRWDRIITAAFDPCEIKTFRIPKDIGQPVIETNLLEWQD
jgi:alpha-mannosidase